MSQTEHQTGKLKPVICKGSLEDTAKSLLDSMGEQPKDYYSSSLEHLEDVGHEKYIVRGDIIYEVEMTELDPYADIFKASMNDDGTINFEVKYYNGGCSFNEAIEGI